MVDCVVLAEMEVIGCHGLYSTREPQAAANSRVEYNPWHPVDPGNPATTADSSQSISIKSPRWCDQIPALVHGVAHPSRLALHNSDYATSNWMIATKEFVKRKTIPLNFFLKMARSDFFDRWAIDFKHSYLEYVVSFHFINHFR